MSFTPHWVDTFPNSISSIFGHGGRSENIVRIGDVLYGVFMHYAFPGDSDGTMVTRKSVDAGVTWADLGVAPSITNPFSTVSMSLTAFVRAGKMELFWAINGVTNVQWQTYDPVSNTWDSVVDTGLPFWWRSPQQYSSLFAGLRPDGSIIVAFPDLITFDLRISKWASGSWSTVAGFLDGGRFNTVLIQSGLIDDYGNAQLFIVRDYDNAGSVTRKLIHVSVDAVTDAVSSEHLIEDDIDHDGDQSIYANNHVGPGHSSGTQLIISYGYRVATNAIDTASYGTLRVAFGDMASDPLNPSWTITSVVADQQGTASSGSHRFMQSQPVIVAGVPWIYWTSAYPSANPIDDQVRLWRSSWTGSAWGTPAVWYDPALDATLASAPITLPNVSNFYLLKAFTNGVGILLNAAGIPNTNPGDPFEFAAYDGPPLRKNNYVSAGGPMVGKGKYASC